MEWKVLDPDLMSWEMEVKRLRKQLKKKSELIKKFKSGEEYQNLAAKLEKSREDCQRWRDRVDELYENMELKDTLYYRSEDAYKRLHDKFEANFKFHEYIKDALVQTADLMENHNAVREQSKTVQERVQATSRKGRTRQPDGAATRPS